MGGSFSLPDYTYANDIQNTNNTTNYTYYTYMDDIRHKNGIPINVNNDNYKDLSYHLTPVAKVTNGMITVKNKDVIRRIPVILVGERHDFESKDTKKYENTVSLLEIIEKYVLYSISKENNARIVMHYEASGIKYLNLDEYFKINDDYDDCDLTVKTNYYIMQQIITRLSNYKYSPNDGHSDERKTDWDKIYELSTSILNKLDYNSNNNCDDIIARNVSINQTVRDIRLLNDDIANYYNNYKLQNSHTKCIDKGFNRILSELRNQYNSINIENIATKYYKDYYSSINKTSFMGQINLIYAGGWLKPEFILNRSSYLPLKNNFKCHLKLVETVTSITDKVEIYNIDYRTIIIINILENLDKLSYSHTIDHYTLVYDLVINQTTLKYSDTKGTNHTIDNPIVQLYSNLNKIDSTICIIDTKSDMYKYSFKKIFIESVVHFNYNRQSKVAYPNNYSYDYYWILDLYSMLQLIYMTKQQSPPSMFISVMGDYHRALQSYFLNNWYSIRNADDKYSSYYLKYESVTGENLPDLSHCIYTDVLFNNHDDDKAFTNYGEKSCRQYLSDRLPFTPNHYIHYDGFRDSLNSYNFFQKYPYDMFHSDDDCRKCFTLDIVDNFGKICDIESLDTYNDVQKNKLFKYLESTTDMFDDKGSSPEQKQKVGGYSSVQGDTLYKIQADFAKYYMNVCGYDDPVKLMTAIKFHLLAIGMAQTTNKENIDISVKPRNLLYEADLPKKTNYSTTPESISEPNKVSTSIVGFTTAFMGGDRSIKHMFIVLLIASIVVILTMLILNTSKGQVDHYTYDYNANIYYI